MAFEKIETSSGARASVLSNEVGIAVYKSSRNGPSILTIAIGKEVRKIIQWGDICRIEILEGSERDIGNIMVDKSKTGIAITTQTRSQNDVIKISTSFLKHHRFPKSHAMEKPSFRWRTANFW